VLVIHENRGLNPYIEDVARRAATEGFLDSRPMASPPSAAIPATTTTGARCRLASISPSSAPIC
jgi:carboxymethylenebutenolidase